MFEWNCLFRSRSLARLLFDTNTIPYNLILGRLRCNLPPEEAYMHLSLSPFHPIPPTQALYNVSKYATTICSTTLLSGKLPATP